MLLVGAMLLAGGSSRTMLASARLSCFSSLASMFQVAFRALTLLIEGHRPIKKSVLSTISPKTGAVELGKNVGYVLPLILVPPLTTKCTSLAISCESVNFNHYSSELRHVTTSRKK